MVYCHLEITAEAVKDFCKNAVMKTSWDLNCLALFILGQFQNVSFRLFNVFRLSFNPDLRASRSLLRYLRNVNANFEFRLKISSCLSAVTNE